MWNNATEIIELYGVDPSGEDEQRIIRALSKEEIKYPNTVAEIITRFNPLSPLLIQLDTEISELQNELNQTRTDASNTKY